MPEEIIILTNGYRQQSHISYSEDLFVGGINHIDRLPTELRRKPFLVGCIQKVGYIDKVVANFNLLFKFHSLFL